MEHISLYEKILESNLINFVIMVWILAIIFKKANLGALLQKAADDVRARIEESQKQADIAIQCLKDAEKSTEKTPEIQKEIIKDAKQNAQNLKEKIEEKTVGEQKDIKANLEKMLLAQGVKAKDDTIKEIYLASVELAQKEIAENLDNEIHKHLIKKSIEQLEGLKN